MCLSFCGMLRGLLLRSRMTLEGHDGWGGTEGEGMMTAHYQWGRGKVGPPGGIAARLGADADGDLSLEGGVVGVRVWGGALVTVVDIWNSFRRVMAKSAQVRVDSCVHMTRFFLRRLGELLVRRMLVCRVGESVFQDGRPTS